jgi:phosphoribosyl-ATP pyrophosphohydrolase/phosphoribosyl-AMP cyclohydrolase
MEPAFDDRGLLPAVVQDAVSGAVLMVAWMNGEALRKTRDTGLVWFWSRSRKALWQKGETSGNVLQLVELRLDCDADAVLVRARPTGPVCHTGKQACFFRRIDGEEDEGLAAVTAIERLEQTIAERKASTAETSYTKSLLESPEKMVGKIEEECGELVAELRGDDEAKIVHEAADVMFHVMVGLASKGVAIRRVWDELDRRSGKSGHVEKAER